MKKNSDEIKIYFIDLDGTTLDSAKDFQRWPSVANLQAIREARALGKEIVISTGRMGQSLIDYAQVIGGNYFIQANGALITNIHNEEVFSAKMSMRQTLLLQQIAKKHKLALKFNDQFNAYGATRFLAKKICQKIGWEPVANYTYDMHQEYFKVVCFGFAFKWKINKIVKEIKNEIPDLSVVTTTGGRSIEITHKDATKGKAALVICQLLNIDPIHSAHVGDSMNDATVINKVGKFIVMKNSERALKKMSPYHGPHYKNGGLAKVLTSKF